MLNPHWLCPAETLNMTSQCLYHKDAFEQMSNRKDISLQVVPSLHPDFQTHYKKSFPHSHHGPQVGDPWSTKEARHILGVPLLWWPATEWQVSSWNSVCLSLLLCNGDNDTTFQLQVRLSLSHLIQNQTHSGQWILLFPFSRTGGSIFKVFPEPAASASPGN